MNYSVSIWTPADRAEALSQGWRPPTPPPRFEPLGDELSLVPQPKHLVPAGFELNPRCKPSDAERAQQADTVLGPWGVR